MAASADPREGARARRALVLGGTGYVGSAVVRELRARGVSVTFTYHRSRELGESLAAEIGAGARSLDVCDVRAVDAAIHDVRPDLFIHCATHADPRRLVDVDDDAWDRLIAVNVRSAFVACRALARTMTAGGDIVLCAGPDAVPTAPAAPCFAASQAAIAGFARAAAADLGPLGIRINAVAFGVLAGGASARGLQGGALADAARYSAIGRVPTAIEAARAIAWLALENSYLNGSVVPLTAGL